MGVWEDCEATYATKETNNSGSHDSFTSGRNCDNSKLLPGWSKKSNNLQRCQILCLFNFDQFWKY